MISLGFSLWWDVFLTFIGMSLLAIGGAITVIPDMHRHLVLQQAWMTDSQFTASIAIAQSAPGPNILVVGMMGWHIGINATQGLWQQYAWGTVGFCVAMLGVMLPSSVLTYGAARWVQKHRDTLSVISFKQGLAPIVVSSILATSWIITVAHDDWSRDWTIWLSTGLTVLLIWKTNIHILWLLGAGAVLGAVGLI
ncbi:MAG: hypothetical protein RIS03_340 [Pseudomonadota bacterium]|jgi:chromate transporter